MKFQKQHEAHFPLGEFLRVNSKFVANFLTNRIADQSHLPRFVFSLCANKFALWKMGFTMVSSSDNICFGNLTSDIQPYQGLLTDIVNDRFGPNSENCISLF